MEGSLTQRMKTIYECSKWQDIEFQLEDELTGKLVSVGAHRLILASCSPVFEALCYGPLAEKNPVFIPDISPEAFKAMLNFLYTDTLQLQSVDMASNVLYAGKKYLLPNLCTAVSKYLSNNITDSNCFDLYNLVCVCDEESLRLTVWDFIRAHLNNAVKYAREDNITTDLIVQLVNEQKMNGDEVTIVKLAQIWAASKCRVLGLEVTGDSLRNMLMQYNIFQKIQWGLLHSEDLPHVFLGLLSDEEMAMFRNPQNNCSEIARVKLPKKMIYIHRFGDAVWGRRCSVKDGLTISTLVCGNRDLTLHSIICHAKCLPLGLNLTNINNLRHYLERLDFYIVDQDGQTLQERKAYRKDVEYGMPFKITLESPLVLEATKSYDIRVRPQHSLADYPCVVRNNCAKIPSGYFVKFTDRADYTITGEFVNASDLSFVSGLECSS